MSGLGPMPPDHESGISEPNVFNIEWNKDIPKSNVTPATKEEIKEVMEVINKRAKILKPGDICRVETRHEVAVAVKLGINSSGSGAAEIDLLEDKSFDGKEGIFTSTLYVAKDRVILDSYISEI